MKIIAKDLKVGDVLMSGETIVRKADIGHFQNRKICFTLKNGDKTRLAWYARYGTIFVKDK